MGFWTSHPLYGDDLWSIFFGFGKIEGGSALGITNSEFFTLKISFRVLGEYVKLRKNW